MEPSVKGILTACSNGSTLVDKMAAMPIYDNKKKKKKKNDLPSLFRR